MVAIGLLVSYIHSNSRNVFHKSSKGLLKIYRLLRLISIAWLLILYLGGNTQIGFLHQLVHPDELASTHSVVQEKNACHRALFHGESSGCDHEFHLGKASSCNLSHTLTHSDQIFISADRSTFAGLVNPFNPVHKESFVNTRSIGIQLRGPPQLHFSSIS